LEGTEIFTLTPEGKPESFELFFKMETGDPAEPVMAGRTRETITAWRDGTEFFDQIVELEGKRQNFILTDFTDPVPDIDPTYPGEIETWTNTFEWSGGLLRRTMSIAEFTEYEVYDYYADDTLKAVRRSKDNVNFDFAQWYRYGDPDFPLLPIEIREYQYPGYGGHIPETYDYAGDPGAYGNYSYDPENPGDYADHKYTYTPNADGSIAEMVVEEGSAWITDWYNSQRIVCSYDPSGKLSEIEYYQWSEGDWELFFAWSVAYSGEVTPIPVEDMYFHMGDYIFPPE
jgi:hypothetical protein